MIRHVPVLLLVFTLVSCGPVYKTNYFYSPPETAQGQACVFQCENSKLQCRRIQELERERCVERADADYYRCEEWNYGRKKKDRAYCYRSFCPSANYEPCEQAYRTCYQTCGGTVTSERVCVSFCDKQ